MGGDNDRKAAAAAAASSSASSSAGATSSSSGTTATMTTTASTDAPKQSGVNTRKRKAQSSVSSNNDSWDGKKSGRDKPGGSSVTGTSSATSSDTKTGGSSSSAATAAAAATPTASDSIVSPAPPLTCSTEIRNDNPYNLRYCMVTNDGQRENLIRLVGLKTLFSRQLPKMPKNYVARLVFDRRHKSLAILRGEGGTDGNAGSSNNSNQNPSDDDIIGGICYRPYPDMRFAEIAFCAVNTGHQGKSYGSKLMNLTKRQAVTEGIEYFITYADNYAIGYFKKQGFTKSISMPKGRFQGFIKDYDGGTLMECYIHPSVDFTRVPAMLQAQREFLLRRIRTVAKSHKVVYPPLPAGHATNSTPSSSLVVEGISARGNEAVARALAIPGVVEAGWTAADLSAAFSSHGSNNKEGDRQKMLLKTELLSLVRKTEEQQFAWPFREPVDTDEVQDYLDVIAEPIDLSTIEKRIRRGDWYKSKHMLYADLMKMVENCKTYNDPASAYYECAENLAKYIKTLFTDL